MRLDEFDYPLPEALIAQAPAPVRDASRLLVVDCGRGCWRHRRFFELPDFLRPGDCLVLNDTRVMPARLFARKRGGQATIELLLIERLAGADGDDCQEWLAMVRPGRRALPGAILDLPGGVTAEVLARGERGERRIRLTGRRLAEQLAAAGELPLPPYIRQRPDDPQRYQTVYAHAAGSVAAPTAGLHFTPALLDRLRAQGVTIATLTLHVGPGTFRPVRTQQIEHHTMHPERYTLPEETAAAINAAVERGGRVVACGTTVVRTLEAVAAEHGRVRAASGSTDLFIYPGYQFRVVDAMITNFHLPRSTLLMLVSAFCGMDEIRRVYREAVRTRYRFFSFGDAMLLVGGGRCGDPV